MATLSTEYLTTKNRYGYFLFHLVAAIVCIAQGLWQTINVLKCYTRSKSSNEGKPFEVQLWYGGPCAKRFPTLSILRIIYGGTFLLEQLYYYFVADGFTPELIQHMVLVSVLLFTGLVDVLACIGVPFTKEINRGVTTSFYLVFTLIFYFHFHHESPLQLKFHYYLVIVCAPLTVAFIVEGFLRRSVIAALTRTFLEILLGLWFFQISITLYVPVIFKTNWSDDSNDSILMLNVLFCAHILVTLIAFLLLSWLVFLSEKNKAPKYYERACNGNDFDILKA